MTFQQERNHLNNYPNFSIYVFPEQPLQKCRKMFKRGI